MTKREQRIRAAFPPEFKIRFSAGVYIVHDDLKDILFEVLTDYSHKRQFVVCSCYCYTYFNDAFEIEQFGGVPSLDQVVRLVSKLVLEYKAEFSKDNFESDVWASNLRNSPQRSFNDVIG